MINKVLENYFYKNKQLFYLNTILSSFFNSCKKSVKSKTSVKFLF